MHSLKLLHLLKRLSPAEESNAGKRQNKATKKSAKGEGNTSTAVLLEHCHTKYIAMERNASRKIEAPDIHNSRVSELGCTNPRKIFHPNYERAKIILSKNIPPISIASDIIFTFEPLTLSHRN